MNRSEYYDAQRVVIGSILLDWEYAAGVVMHRSREEDYTGEYKTLFRACRELFQAGKPVDAVTVRDKAGPQYTPLLAELVEETPTAANVEVYLDILVEKSKLLRIQSLAASMVNCISLEDAQKLVEKQQRILGDRPGVKIVTMEQGLLSFYDRQRQPANLVPWGLDKVDGTFRCEYGDFIVVGG